MSFRYTSVAQLLRVFAYVKAHPEQEIAIPHCWPEQTYTWPTFRQWFWECLDRKISAGGSKAVEATIKPRGRKDCYEYGLDMFRAQQQLNNPRLRVDWLPKDLKQRFAHRLYHREDDR